MITLREQFLKELDECTYGFTLADWLKEKLVEMEERIKKLEENKK